MAKRWIQKAIKRPGALTRFAKAHGIAPPFSASDLARLRRIAQKLPGEQRTRRLRQINLAETLKSMRRKKK